MLAVNVEAWHRADKRPDVLGMHGHRVDEQAVCIAIMQGFKSAEEFTGKTSLRKCM